LTRRLGPSIHQGRLLQYAGAALILGLLAALMAWALPSAVDWHYVFRPAAAELAHGRSPYQVVGFYNSPWILLPLVPLLALPEDVGRGVLAVLSLAALTYTARRLGARTPALIALLLSPPVLHGLLNGSLDSLVVLGFVLPPSLGLVFLSAKPQIGMAVALFWIVEAWRRDRLRGVIRLAAPTVALLLASLVLFGAWPLRATEEISLWWNASLWPASIPIGLALVAAALWKGRVEFAIAASPFLSPYVLLHSWVVVLLAMSGNPYLLIPAVFGLWGVVTSRLVPW
jgi:hypothetical protein